jgi:hypothetical protein
MPLVPCLRAPDRAEVEPVVREERLVLRAITARTRDGLTASRSRQLRAKPGSRPLPIACPARMTTSGVIGGSTRRQTITAATDAMTPSTSSRRSQRTTNIESQ